MPPELVFNELSPTRLSATTADARTRVSRMVRTIHSAVDAGAERHLRVRADFQVSVISEQDSYSINDWLYDGAVDRDERRYLLTLTTKYPLLRDVDTELQDEWGMSHVEFGGQEAQGLGVAYILNGIAVSVDSESPWDHSQINVHLSKLIEDQGSEVEVSESTVPVSHASTTVHIDELREWIQTRKRLEVLSVDDVLERREELLPHLRFCDAAIEGLRRIESNADLFKQARDRLFDLNEYAESWNDGPFDPTSLRGKASRESTATMEAYGEHRQSKCEEEVVQFEWHLRLTPGANRLYFVPRPADTILLVGHIGSKLPTVTDPT